MIQDTFILQSFMPQLLELRDKHPKTFRVVYYFPIDAAPKHDWVEDVVGKIDYPVAYTNYARDECRKFAKNLELPVIYHGNNSDD